MPQAPGLLALQDPRVNARYYTSASKIPSKSIIGRIEHPLPSNRFKMNAQCFVDPPSESTMAENDEPGNFYSFNPAAQQCEKLYIGKSQILPFAPNVYENLKDCQADCCPTSLCKNS